MEDKGFSLLDSLMVCLLLGSALTLGAASLNGIFERYRLQWAGYVFSSEISDVRSEAVGRNSPVSILVDVSRNKYGFGQRDEEPRLWRLLPRGVLFVSLPTVPVTFYSRGNAVPAGSYLLQNRAGQMRVIIAPSGRVRWELVE